MKDHKFSKTGYAGLILAGVLLINSCSVSRTTRVNPDHSARQKLTYLASDALAGRLPGSTGDSLSPLLYSAGTEAQ